MLNNELQHKLMHENGENDEAIHTLIVIIKTEMKIKAKKKNHTNTHRTKETHTHTKTHFNQLNFKMD